MLYLIPRVLMGLLAVVDTFLIYKISERRYNRNVAIIASILFAVMPLSWLMRRILLDTILMPFLLSSILFAVYNTNKITNTKFAYSLKDKNKNRIKNKNNHNSMTYSYYYYHDDDGIKNDNDNNNNNNNNNIGDNVTHYNNNNNDNSNNPS